MTVQEIIMAMHKNAANNTPVVVRLPSGRRFDVTDFDFEYDPKNNIPDTFILEVDGDQ